MTPLAADDLLPLTCSRDGVCCHGARVGITPWELAVLARGAGLEPRLFRDRHTREGGTVLAFTGAPDRRGKPACDLYREGSGCSVHPQRPLACRLYPLGRGRRDGVAFYHHPGSVLPCSESCPASRDLPRLRVDDYLRGQAVAQAEAAHDGYAGLLAGLVGTAGQIAARAGGAIDRMAVDARLDRLAGAAVDQRLAQIPGGWLDRLILPGLPDLIADPPAYVDAHRRDLAEAIAHGRDCAGIDDMLLTILALALHLAPVLGTAPALVVGAFRSAAG